MQRREWDRYEAVVLLEGYLETLDKQVPKSRLVKRISADLRQMAINNDMNIDDTYRNENGITFQMQSMEAAYCGKSAMKRATHLFTDIVVLYRSNHSEYENLLKEAKAMINGKPNYKAAFSSWFAMRASGVSSQEMLSACDAVEQFCLKMKILKEPLFETTDLNILKTVLKMALQNKFFRIITRKQTTQIDTAMLWLNKFIREGNLEKFVQKSASTLGTPIFSFAPLKTPSETKPSQAIQEKETEVYIRTEQDKRLLSKYPIVYKHVFHLLLELFENGENETTVTELYEKLNHIAPCAWIEEILDNVSWAVYENKHYSFSTQSTKLDNEVKPTDSASESQTNNIKPLENVVDFNNISNYAYTKPTSLYYFGEAVIGLSTWTGLYVELFSNLYDDYPQLFKVGMSFTSSCDGRVDLCGQDLRNTMTAPKPIPNTSLFLETNLSAENIVLKIRFLLDLCAIDYENVIIKYQKKSDIITAAYIPPMQHQFSNYENQFDDKELAKNFALFLNDYEKMAESTCKSYVSAISIAERFAENHQYAHHHLLTCDKREAKATADALLCDTAFIAYNRQHYNRFGSAIKRLMLFLGVNAITSGCPAVQPVPDEAYQKVLITYFCKGFRLGSPIELRKFKRYYEQLNETPLVDDDAEIEQKISVCGILFEDKVFTPQTMLSDTLRDRLFAYTNDCFAAGKTALYYQAIFNEFSEDFLDYYIYNAGMLKAYLAYLLSDKYFFDKSYLSKHANVTADPADEIRTCLKEYAAPMAYDVLFEDLSHIPQQKIKQILAINNEFVSNGRREYFHVSAVHFSDEEIDNIADIITEAIKEKEFVSGNELVSAIQSKYPYTYEKNATFSMVGLRDTIKYYLDCKFSFSGNIISRLGSALTMSEVFADFCRVRDEFTLDELNVFAVELGTVIYFDPVYDNSLRISKDRFVSKKRAHFLVAETDAALDRFCTGSSIPISKIRDFGILPNAYFPWNSFLLEHYVAAYSERYCLLHIGFNANSCVGAIVKRSAGFNDFDDCMVEILANSNVMLKKQSALQYLYDEGYIGRRSYTNIEELLIKATAQRNRKGAN